MASASSSAQEQRDPVEADDRTEQLPHKAIISQAHLDAFLSSPAHEYVVTFIEELNTAVIGATLTDPCNVTPPLERILDVMNQVDNLVTDCPPVDNASSRFGNPAFRKFYDGVKQRVVAWHLDILQLDRTSAEELSVYLTESWGNRTRIDYGSGMELNFLCWLLCLRRLDYLVEGDNRALVIKVFWRYLQIMRTLQSTYWLEPAGSHGVWGLDDYHFLPFLFGSAQLRGHKHIRPKSIHDPDVLEGFSDEYIYLACIRFINSIKTASLRWHSPMLDDISGVKSWEKVNVGMIKMYKAEVLARLPVAQHFLFGHLLPPPCPLSGAVERGNCGGAYTDANGHVHVKGQGWGECCGIPIPSGFAAALEMKESPSIRRVPFD